MREAEVIREVLRAIELSGREGCRIGRPSESGGTGLGESHWSPR